MEVPPKLRTPVAPLTRVPFPARDAVALMVPLLFNVTPVTVSAVATVKIPLFMGPAPVVNVTDGMTVGVVPLRAFPAPLKVYSPAPAVKVVALLTKLPLKVGVLATVSFHQAPALRVTSPVNMLARAVVERFIVPVIDVAPDTVRTREQVKVPPLSIVSATKVTVVPLVVAVRVPPF